MVQYHRKSYAAYFFAKICCPYLDIRGACSSKILSLIWSMGAGGAQQVLINYLRAFSK